MSNVNRPVIPAEVADEIEHLRSGVGYGKVRTNTEICELAMRRETPPPVATQILRTIPFDTLLAALVNGYERELTEEERTHDAIKREWINRDSRRQRNAYCDGFADGIEFVLGEISMLIEGVNA